MDLSGIDTRILRKYILFGFISLTALIFIIWYFSNSWLYVTTSKDATITIYQGGGTTKQTKGKHLFTALTPGDYTIEVRTETGATSRFSAQGHGAFVKINLETNTTQPIQDVIAHYTRDLSASKDRLSYLQAGQVHGFQSITPDTYTTEQPNQTFESIKWLDPSFGVAVTIPHGEGIDTEPVVGVISNTKDFTPLSLPESISHKATSVDVSLNRDILLSIDSTLYRKRSSDSEFHKIYSGNGPLSILSSTKDIILFEKTPSSHSEDETVHGEIILIDTNGKKIGSQKESYAVDPTNAPYAKQSPDGKYIAALVAGRVTLYDSHLQNYQRLPQPGSATSLTWRDDTTLLFSSKNTIWRYSFEDRLARSLAVDSSDRTINTLSFDKKGDSVYFSSIGKKSTDTLGRVSISGGSPNTDEVTRKITTILPYNVAMALCRADYVNFTKPAVVIWKLREESNSSMEANMQWCLDEVKSYLIKQKVDPNSVQFIQNYVDTLGSATVE